MDPGREDVFFGASQRACQDNASNVALLCGIEFLEYLAALFLLRFTAGSQTSAGKVRVGT